MNEPKRLRVLDINTPWFWLTIFYEPLNYGDSWLKIELWELNKWKKWWFHFWKWEDIPSGIDYDYEPQTRREENL